MFGPKTITQCPLTPDHRSIDRAHTRVGAMGRADLLDWTTNVAYDVAALVDRHREGDESAVVDLGLALAMLHACIAEVTLRSTGKV